MDRPSDMTFVCLAMVDGVLSGQPMSQCHVRNQADPPTTSNGVRTRGTFAFIPNVGRGELAVADMDTGRLLDLGPASPGYGMIPVGGDPESIAASQDGCWVATANRATCDFTLVDPSRLLTDAFNQGSTAAEPSTGLGDSAHRISNIQTASGRKLHTATGEIAFLPSVGACQAGATARAVATFPGCDMVALLDFSFESRSATIASAYYVRPDLPGGFQAAGAEPVCPDDCTVVNEPDGGGQSEQVDGGTADDGGAVIDAGRAGGGRAGGLRPLALVPDGARVYVGSLRDTAITSLEIGSAGLGNPRRLQLAGCQAPGQLCEEDPAGVGRIRLSVDPYLPSADMAIEGQFLPDHGSSKDGRFLYAFTHDDSVRVVDITDALPVECDVNLVPNDRTKSMRCVPVGSPLAQRRALARGPGLRVPTFSGPDSPPPLPRDISFADLVPANYDTNVQSLSGKFGFLLASNGQVYVVNIAPSGEDNVTSTHSFREVRDIGKPTRTPLAISIAPQRSVVISNQAFATTATFAAQGGPLIQPFDGTTNWFELPDPDTIISRSWDVTWEGVLPDTARGTGSVMPVTVLGRAAVGLSDRGADFCSSGVQAGDVLMFTGCVQDSDCQPDDEFLCQVTVSGGRGICLPRDGAARSALVGRPQCGRFMGSRMRYEIAAPTRTSLALNLKLDEVPKTSLNPCTQDQDCRPDADHGSVGAGSLDGGAAVARAFECLEVRPQERRCVQKCQLTNGDADCRAGNVCEPIPGTLPLGEGIGLCVQAPPLDPTCFTQPMTSYSVHAGNSYMVYGSSLPRMRTSKAPAAADGVCEVDKTANPELVNRIPLSAPQCPDSFLSQATTTFVQRLSARAGSNPCLYTGLHNDGDPGAQHIRAFYENPQIRFVLNNLDQYVGDLASIHFEFQYGFVPLVAPIPNYEVQTTLPVRIITGPTMTPESPVRRNPPANITYPYIYVVDQGRTVLAAGSRGQVLRINPRAGSSEIITFDTAISGSTPFQLQ